MNNKLIIWDWNGTLLNDVDACVKAMNIMLTKRGRNIITQDKYKEIFTFPVKNYYVSLGFDFEQESFEKLSVEYIDLYKKLSFNSPLQQGSMDILEFFKLNDFKQIILSASEQLSLENQVKQRGIYYYFDSIIGLDNIYAKSKLENAINYLKDSIVKFDQVILIGDTYHDYEVAKEIGAECILVDSGHQNLCKYNLNGMATIVKAFSDIKQIFNSKKAPTVINK